MEGSTSLVLFNSILFALFNLVAAWLVWTSAKTGVAEKTLGRALRVVLPCLFLATMLGLAVSAERGDRLQVSLSEMRVPLGAVIDGNEANSERKMLVLANRPGKADLITSPYQDQQRSREVLTGPPFELASVSAKAAPDGQNLQIKITTSGYDPKAESNLPGMAVLPSGTEKMPSAADYDRSYVLAPGESKELTVYRLDPNAAKPAERRSFTIRNVPAEPSTDEEKAVAPYIALTLVSPMEASAGSCKSPLLRLAPARWLDAPSDGMAASGNLSFAGLGEGGDFPVLDPQWLGLVAPANVVCTGQERKIEWPLAESASDKRLIFRTSSTYLPWFVLIFTLAISIATALLFRPQMAERKWEAAVVFGLQWLLTIRMLVAIGGSYLVEDQSLSNALLDSAVAYGILPVIAMLVMRPTSLFKWDDLLATMVFLLGVIWAISIWMGADQDWGMSLPIVYLAVALWLYRIVARYLQSGLPGSEWANERLEKARSSLPIAPVSTILRRGLLVLAILATIRIGLVLAGDVVDRPWKEKIGPFRFSIFWTSAMVIAAAVAMHAKPSRPVLLAAGITLSYVLMAGFIADFGVIMVFFWPVAAVLFWRFALPALREKQFRTSAILGTPLLVPFGIILLGLVVAMTPIPDADKDLGGHIAAANALSGNEVRLLRYIQPERLEDVGTKLAYQTIDQAANLGPLIENLWGQGYLAPYRIGKVLLENHYSDNLPAVHIMAPFGRVGIVSLIIFIACLVWALLAAKPAGSRNWLHDAALAAGLTLVWSAIYMTMANMNLVPFTGKNIYFLAATSGADLLEGLGLLLVLTAPLWWPDQAAARGDDG